MLAAGSEKEKWCKRHVPQPVQQDGPLVPVQFLQHLHPAAGCAIGDILEHDGLWSVLFAPLESLSQRLSRLGHILAARC